MALRDEESADACLLLMIAIGLLLFGVGATLVVVGYYIPGVDHVSKDLMVANGFTIGSVGIAISCLGIVFLYMRAQNKLDLSSTNLQRGHNMSYSGSRDLEVAGRTTGGW
ncbi:PREDICTED: uncharacterized protein LOC106814305 [Priapulus caudatus]|uniref:Uncharacterized protein LOC106814305 n=1 Tax=Priapulus caudatus TaxID=37621 RepID=A0ABM1EPH1_PRICU|nr:PREDICTED: uncharacterized protein LOC106814305 [Priapulus caudatus]